MNKRVYSVIGVKSVMANWNADFTGYPKEISDGTIFGSDKALKYAMKKVWDNQGEKVLYIKSYKMDGDKIQPRDLNERYKYVFETDELSEKTKSEEILKCLFKAIDVRQFGATFAEAKNNISITGAVQVGQGLSKYHKDTHEQQILSPFRDSKDGDAANSTIGTKIVSEETHYFYPVSINPSAYNDYQALGVTDGYTEDDYQNYKNVALVAATAINTNSKAGCENEFALFVEVGEKVYLPDLTQFIEFTKNEGAKDKIAINLSNVLKGLDVQAIEVYYNSDTIEVDCDVAAKNYNIFTREEV
jgi:Uncharacterized protein predicted to be involved in DNA repair